MPEVISLPANDLHWHKLSSHKRTGQRVLIKKTEYDIEWATQETRLSGRIQSISQLRNQMPVTGHELLPMLQSLGYTHDASNCEFGIVYAFPPGCETDPVSLHTVITETGKYRTSHPSLSERFMLTFTLARHVLNLHTMEWLHKSLCSYNIISFPDLIQGGGDTSKILESRPNKPYIIGFDLARFNSYTAFPTGPTLGTTQINDYQHPAYLRAMNLQNIDNAIQETATTEPERYRQEFDYYSVGLIFLEIAFWKPLASILCKAAA